jgi:hypothetical protein
MIELFKVVLGLVRSFFRPDAELILDNLALGRQAHAITRRDDQDQMLLPGRVESANHEPDCS